MREHELILHNGHVLTLDPASRTTEAIGVTAGTVSALGTSSEVLAGRGHATRVIDLEGATVCPGFYDSHAHMDREGLKARGGFSLAGRHSVKDIVEGVRLGVERTPPGEWAVFMPLGTPKLNYIHRPDQLAEGRFPTRHDLDAVSPDNPVYIRVPWGWWVHRPFVSASPTREALELAGIGPDTQAPYNVEILREGNGEPTGVFLDRSYAPVIEYTLLALRPAHHLRGSESRGAASARRPMRRRAPPASTKGTASPRRSSMPTGASTRTATSRCARTSR